VLAVVLVVGFLLPLNIGARPVVVTTHQPMATVLGTGWSGIRLIGTPMLFAFAAWAVALRLARGVAGRAAAALVLLGVALLAATLLRTNPVGSHDVYHNVADARTLWVYGDNPTVVPPDHYPADHLANQVWAWRDFPSIYGPVWYLVAGAPLPFIGDGFWENVIGQKVLAAAFLLAATALVMATAERLRRGTGVAAGVLFGWNPLALWVTAGNAHNDIVMVTFGLAAIYATVRRWWLAVFPLLALAVATKHVLIILAPVLLAWLWRRRDVPRRRILDSLGLGALIGLLVYSPFLGPEMFASLGGESDLTTASVAAVVQAVLVGLFAVPLERAVDMSMIALGGVFLAGYVAVLWRLPRDGDGGALVRAAFWSVFLFLVLARFWFWPWYVLWLLPFGALLPGSRPALVAAVFSLTAMLGYIPYQWLAYTEWHRWQLASAATLFVLPVLAALWPHGTNVDADAGRPRWATAHRRGRRVGTRAQRREGVAVGGD